MTNYKKSRISVGIKRECSLFLKSIFLPSRITSDKGALPGTRQKLFFFFFSFFPKSKLLMGSATQAICHCSEVQAGSSACSLFWFSPFPHGKFFQALISGLIHGLCHDEINVPSSDWNSKKNCVSDPNWFGWENKGSNILSSSRVLCPNQQTPPAVCQFSSSLNSLWVWRRPKIYLGKICSGVGATEWMFTLCLNSWFTPARGVPFFDPLL